jgi:hypothetical protein
MAKTLIERVAYLEAIMEELKSKFPPLEDKIHYIATIVGGVSETISRDN